MTLAQKKARENFKKAIEYRKKTGCSLKEAFAHIKGKHTVVKKVGAVKKKSAKKKVLISPLKKVARKKAAPKKIAAKKPNLKYRGTLKSEAGKKMYKYSLGAAKAGTHKDTKSHNVNIRVVSGISGYAMNNIKHKLEQIKHLESLINSNEIAKKNTKDIKQKKAYTNSIKKYKELIKEDKIHITQLKKHIK